jgi:type I restriction enzyme S subunit
MSDEQVSLDEVVEEYAEEGSESHEWRTVKLSDVTRKRAENVDASDIDGERHVGLEHIEPNTPKPDWEDSDELSSTKRRFYSEDILFAKLRPNLEKAAQPDFDGVCSTDIFTIEAEDGVNSKYLLYRLSSKPAYDHARRTSVGTRMPRTSWNLFSNFEFDLPPLPEQRKIASVLYNVDEAIRKTEEIIEGTKRVKKGVMQEVFREGIEGKDTKETWLGEVPNDWEIVQFSELISETRNGIYKKEDEYGGDYPILKMGDMFGDIVLKADPDEMEKVELSDKEIEKYEIQQGDLLFARRSLNVEGAGECTLIPELSQTTVFESSMIRVRLEETAFPNFYAQYFESPVGSKSIERIVTTTTASGIAGEDLRNLRIPLPELEEQQQIADVLEVFDERIDSLIQEKSRLHRLKRALMQDLLTGEVRTNDRDIDVLPEVEAHG